MERSEREHAIVDALESAGRAVACASARTLIGSPMGASDSCAAPSTSLR